MTAVYNTENALADFHLISSQLRKHSDPIPAACERVEEYLLSLKTSEPVPTDRPCIGCLFHYDVAGTDECLSADAPDIGAAQRCGVSCEWFEGFESLAQAVEP